MITRRAWALCALSYLGCAGDPSPHEDEHVLFSGGSATVFDDTRDAFAQALPTLMGDREDDFFVGNSVFNRGWVQAPASVASFDGLGPLFNATNCSSCHFKDGRGRPPLSDDEPFNGLLLRLSVPGADPVTNEPTGEPTYGGQLQDNGIHGVMPEARPHVAYRELPGAFADGQAYSLRMPTYTFDQLAYGAMAPDVMVSPRVAQGVYGLGLLEAIDEATLVALADPDDVNQDGISGRPNHVWDYQRKAKVLGRFGWKANQPTLEQQSLAAFNGDVGITSQLFPLQNCTPAEVVCESEPSGAEASGFELDASFQRSVVHYVHTLAVPGRRNLAMPEVKRGAKVFHDAGCEGCHVPQHQTGMLADFPELSLQTIRPYTDLLLHDMGPDLADNRPDFEATGSEWRTAPLWGIGLVQRVNGHSLFLHDGRARGFLEAVMFHGGEALASREKVRALSKEDRAALVAFLESL